MKILPKELESEYSNFGENNEKLFDLEEISKIGENESIENEEFDPA